MHRVLAPGGVVLILDLRRDASREAIDAEVDRMELKAANKFMVGWTFRHMLLKSAYTPAEMENMVSQTPFHTCKIDLNPIGFQVRLEKPAL